MNFFKSILSDDPEPENIDNHRISDTDQSPKHQQTERAEDEHTNLNSTSSGEVSGGGGGLWSFGDLVKTITNRSESVLETYRRDLKEFSSGLKKESDLFREVASRAVKELPTSIEVGASSAIDGVLKSTAEIISQGKDVLLQPSDVNDSDDFESVQHNIDRNSSLSSRGYSRFDSQLNSIQIDARTYYEDPEDLDDYSKWKLDFLLIDKEIEIEKLIGENGSVEAIYRKGVPNEVDNESFWCRYFYRVHKLKQQEDVRANLVRRSLTVDDEEELSWDVDDEEEVDSPEIETKQSSNDENDESKTVSLDLEKNTEAAIVNKNNTDDTKLNPDLCVSKVESVSKCDEIDGNEKVESVPKNDENEDLEWDEIGDIGENDEKEILQGETVKKDNVIKQLNTTEDDEDLSWDIEDDDEPVKASSSK